VREYSQRGVDARGHTGGHTEALYICRVHFFCCSSVRQRRVVAPA
jgi:hypothetical protein